MRQCKIASCCKLSHHPCCKDCKEHTCTNRCLNSPKRCGCWWESAPPHEASPNPRKGKSKIDRQELLRLHDLGLLQREIAERVGCSASMVSATLRKMGVRRYG